MSELALQKDLVLEYLCDGVHGLGYKQEPHGMVSERLFLTADLQLFLKESSPDSWRKVRRKYPSDDALTEAIEEQLYRDILSSQSVATFFKQRLNSFTFDGEPFFLFFASGGSIGEGTRDFEKNIFTVVPEMAYSFKYEGETVFSFRPDLAFFLNGVYFGYCELKSTIDSQTAAREGRLKIAKDYVSMVQAYAEIAHTNDVTETLRRRMMHVFEKAIHITTSDLGELYVIRGISSLTKSLKDRFARDQIYPSDAISEVVEQIKRYPSPVPEECDPVVLFKETFSRFYARKEVEKEIRYYNFLKYNYKAVGGDLVRVGNRGTLVSPRPKQKFGVDKVISRLWDFLDHESEPDYYTDRLRRQLEAQRLSPDRIEQIVGERARVLNNKYIYSLLLQYAAGFGKSNIIGWLASMMSDMRRDGEPVFDKILIVVDRLQLRDQLNEMMTNMNLSRVNFSDVTNRQELIRGLGDHAIRVMVVNIQKFGDFDSVVAEAGLGTRQMRVAFIIDEIHRSNSGKLHDEMRSGFETLQDALERPYVEGEEQRPSRKNVIIGLTATPSDAVLARFGEFYKTEETRPIWIPFDSYTMREAIEDGYILNPAAHIYCWPVVMEYTVPPGMSNEEEKYTLRKQQIYRNPERIREISRRIVERLYTTVYPSIRGYGKAMLATSSIEAAQIYVREIRKAIEARGPQERFGDAKVYIVYSDRQDMPSASTYNDGMSEEAVIAAFKQGKNGLMIVVDKLQTGFDEPLLHTLFLDKEITDINAIQTISRVNRIARDKVDCHIVDISHQNVNKVYIRQALEKYCDLTFTILEPQQALDRLSRLKRELEESEPYFKFFGTFVKLQDLAEPQRTTQLNSLLLRVEEWIRHEIAEAKKRIAAAREESDDTGEDFTDQAKRLKSKVGEYMGLIFNFNGIIEIDTELRDPNFMAFWEHYRRIYNTITRSQSGKSEIGVRLDAAGLLPAQSMEIAVTVYPEDKVESTSPDLPESPTRRSTSSPARPDSVAEFVKKLNLEAEPELDLINEARQIEQDFLGYVAADRDFQNMIHTPGGLISDETKVRRFRYLITHFWYEAKGDYSDVLANYLIDYKDRLYDMALGWTPIGLRSYPEADADQRKVAEGDHGESDPESTE